MAKVESVRIAEIYDSIQGESTLMGLPCTLIRLAGCPLRCTYCDTPHALTFQSGKAMPIDAVVEQAAARARPLILVTGGEPLAQKHTAALLSRLSRLPAIIQLETSGAYDIRCARPPVRRILDIKTPGSGEMEMNRWSNLEDLRMGDELKFIICDERDYLWAKDVIREHALLRLGIPILFSPAWGKLAPKELAHWILRDNLRVRLHLQQHKIIWGEEEKQR